MLEIRQRFDDRPDGLLALTSRTALVDSILRDLWAVEVSRSPLFEKGAALMAVGGYGRAQLFPFSDVDLLFALEKSRSKEAKQVQDGVRRISQALWDCGLRAAITTRTSAECQVFEPGNAEFSLALLDCRPVAGDPALVRALQEKAIPRLLSRERKRITRELAGLTVARHRRYGDTLFHLEPNVKDCPGGLRDAHVTAWLRRLRSEPEVAASVPGEHGRNGNEEFAKALAFFAAARCFLHYRHERDDNVLDWQSQDAAAERSVGLEGTHGARSFGSGAIIGGAAHWMRVYFRHARAVERVLQTEAELSGISLAPIPGSAISRLPLRAGWSRPPEVLELGAMGTNGEDLAFDPKAVLELFISIARTGARLTAQTEVRIADAIPRLSSRLEEGRELWRMFRTVLLGRYAGTALRVMHALGLLDLILPEFHGIDALVVRDAYHRYTVDEHTFVLIDTLHDLEDKSPADGPDWRTRLSSMYGELEHPDLLLLGALMHDTGKARTGENHALESVLLADKVLGRFEMDSFETSMVLQLIETHLEMSAALRRDIFDVETVRGFASKVQTHESLRILTLFTYADIAAVHPDALTPWKAENLWRLSMATSNQLDRHVDDDRFSLQGTRGLDFSRMLALARGRPAPLEAKALETFLDGLPERYLRTRTVETVLQHAEMAARCPGEPVQVGFRHGDATSEITIVTYDRPQLFADCASALTAWGMNVVTADAFSNAAGVVVDSFRFTDTFRTLALNAEEHGRFVESVRDLLGGRTSLERMLTGRRRSRRPSPRLVVETVIDFDETASSHSTVLQVIAQDVPGLLRAIALGLGRAGCNVEVALVDTEGEMAIDVFYITRAGVKLTRAQQKELRSELLAVIDENNVRTL